MLVFNKSSLECKHAARSLLKEENDQNEHDDFCCNCSSERLQKLIGQAQAHGPKESSPEIAHSSEDYDHERVDDIRLPQIWAHIS
jgi:hypothetical protein